MTICKRAINYLDNTLNKKNFTIFLLKIEKKESQQQKLNTEINKILNKKIVPEEHFEKLDVAILRNLRNSSKITKLSTKS